MRDCLICMYANWNKCQTNYTICVLKQYGEFVFTIYILNSWWRTIYAAETLFGVELIELILEQFLVSKPMSRTTKNALGPKLPTSKWKMRF